MLRLNAFFEVKSESDIDRVKTLAAELVEKSRADEGNIAYDLFQSTTNPRVMMFCETWKDDATLAIHAAAEHFTRIVPMIEALSVNGLKLERFEF